MPMPGVVGLAPSPEASGGGTAVSLRHCASPAVSGLRYTAAVRRVGAPPAEYPSRCGAAHTWRSSTPPRTPSPATPAGERRRQRPRGLAAHLELLRGVVRHLPSVRGDHEQHLPPRQSRQLVRLRQAPSAASPPPRPRPTVRLALWRTSALSFANSVSRAASSSMSAMCCSDAPASPSSSSVRRRRCAGTASSSSVLPPPPGKQTPPAASAAPARRFDLPIIPPVGTPSPPIATPAPCSGATSIVSASGSKWPALPSASACRRVLVGGQGQGMADGKAWVRREGSGSAWYLSRHQMDLSTTPPDAPSRVLSKTIVPGRSLPGFFTTSA